MQPQLVLYPTLLLFDHVDHQVFLLLHQLYFQELKVVFGKLAQVT
jgi:hypothetical protein